MLLDTIHKILDFVNLFYLEQIMKEEKWCKPHGWVAHNYDCEGCNQCEEGK